MTTKTLKPSARFASWGERIGLDRARSIFALRTAIGACLAVLIAWLMGLDHPQWAGMTVWAASQPTRGQLLEKGFFRIAGTIAGAVAGMVLMMTSGGNPYVIAAGLAVWVGLCAAIGNLQRGYVSYGTIVAGYSAAMVVLLDSSHPDHVVGLGLDRMATILTGVIVSIVVSWLLASAGDESEVTQGVRLLTGRVLQEVANTLRGERSASGHSRARLLSEIAELDDKLDPHGAGSLKSRRFVKSARGVLLAELAAILWLTDGPVRSWPPEVADALEKAAQAANANAPHREMLMHLDHAVDVCSASADPGMPAPLEHILGDLRAALRRYLPGQDEGRGFARTGVPVMLHHDFVGARQAGIRAFTALLAIGILWAVTGISSGPYMLLGLSIMVSMFSTFENPASFMPFVFVGQASGAAVAVICRWVFWPHATSELQLILMLFPFILVGAFLMGHRRTVKFAFDYNMVLLLLSSPALPLTGTLEMSVVGAISVAAAPVLALLMYRLIYPTDAARRAEMLERAIVGMLREMAASPGAGQNVEVIRARLYYRILRLVRWHEKRGNSIEQIARVGIAVINLADVIHDLQVMRAGDLPSRQRRAAEAVLRSVATIDAQPRRAAAIFGLASSRLSETAGRNGGRLLSVGQEIAANAAFFARAV
ncbi:FUSC family protein [Martelella endophytica]|uniref:FUSC family protein n=1 Tax=Martelella endophytica TaxID=1486262 RepID=UPI0005F2066C|nr:FUSC family protein [Martelella endophytica]